MMRSVFQILKNIYYNDINLKNYIIFLGSCFKTESEAGGCGAEWRRALRLDPARDLQRLHALLVRHMQRLSTRLLHLRKYTEYSEN